MELEVHLIVHSAHEQAFDGQRHATSPFHIVQDDLGISRPLDGIYSVVKSIYKLFNKT
jgi:hypothetical protein